MAAEFYVGSFVGPAAGGAQTQAVTGVGFQPTAIIVWRSSDESPVTTNAADGAILAGFGVAVGPAAADQSALSALSQFGSFNKQSYEDGVVISIGTASKSGDATLNSFDADGFTLGWSNSGQRFAVPFSFLAIGGAGASLIRFTTPGSTGPQSYTGTGFTPGALVVAASLRNSTPSYGVDDSVLGIGVSDGLTDRAVAWFSNDQDPASAEARVRADAAVLYALNGTATSNIEQQATVASLDADGFTLNYATSVSASRRCFALALNAADVSASVVAVDYTAALGSQSVTGVGFRPLAGFFLTPGGNYPLSSDGTQGFGSRASYGASDGTRSRTTSLSVQNGGGYVAASSQSYFRDDVIIHNQDDVTASTSNDRISLTSFDADGFTISKDAVADAGAFSALLLSPAGVPPNAPTIVAPADGSSADPSAPLLVDWTFNDPDAPSDAQSAYALVRKRLP